MDFHGYPFEVRPLSPEDGGGFLITFPDLPECMSEGQTIEETLAKGQDALADWLLAHGQKDKPFPNPGDSKIEALRESYESIWTIRDVFTKLIENDIRELIAKHGISIHLVTSRTKDVNSFIEKVIKHKCLGKNVFDLIKDISGIRIIVFYTDHCDEIEKIIRDNYCVLDEYSENKNSKLKLNEFDYQSIHLVAKIKPEIAKAKQWMGYKNFVFEIQIRTLLQHAWASRSHELQYKKTIEDKYIRELSILAAMIDKIDSDFLNLRDNISYSTKKIEEQHDSEHLSIDSIQEIINNSIQISELNQFAKSIDFIIINNHRPEFLAHILNILNKIGVQNTNQLIQFLSDNIQNMKKALAIWKVSASRNRHNMDTLLIIIILLVSRKQIDFKKEIEDWEEGVRSCAINAYNAMD